MKQNIDLKPEYRYSFFNIDFFQSPILWEVLWWVVMCTWCAVARTCIRQTGGWRRPNTPNTCKVTPKLSPKWLQGRHGEGSAHAWHDGPCTLFQNHHLIRFISLITLYGLCSWWSQKSSEWNVPPPKIYSVQGPFRFVFPISIEPRTGRLTWPPFGFWLRFGFWPGDLTPHTSESIYDRPFTWQSHNPSDLVSWWPVKDLWWVVMCTWCAITRPLTNLHPSDPIRPWSPAADDYPTPKHT